MKAAFQYMFNDNKFWQKAGIYFIFAILTTFFKQFFALQKAGKIFLSLPAHIVIGIFSILASLIVIGYQIKNIKAIVEQNSDNIVIPFLSLKKDLFTGFKYSCAYLLLMIPALVIPLGFLCMAGLSSLLPKSSPIWIFLTIYSIAIIAFIIFILFFAYFSPGYMYMFTQDDKWTVFYNFKQLFKNTLTKQYFLAILCLLGASIVYNSIYWLTSFVYKYIAIAPSIIIQVVIASVIGTYVFFFSNYIIAKSVKSVEKYES